MNKREFIKKLDHILVNKVFTISSVDYSAAKEFIEELHKIGGKIIIKNKIRNKTTALNNFLLVF